MLDLARELSAWLGEGRDFAVATVVAVSGSAPRPPGAALAVDGQGTAIGSVSGGCVEGEVYELCREALAHGECVLRRFGYSDEDAFAVGLTCGGIIDVLVTPITTAAPARPVLGAALAAAVRGEPAAVVRVVRGAGGGVGGAGLVGGAEAVGGAEVVGEAGLVGGAGSVGRAGRVGGAGSVGWAGRVGEAESVGGAGLVGEAVESVGGVELAGPIDPVGGAEAVDGAGRVGEAVESVGGVELAGPIDPVGGAEAVDGAGLVGEAVESVGGVESVGPIAPVVGGQLVLGAALFVRSDGSYDGGLGGYAGLDGTAAAQARALLAAGRTGTVELAPDGSLCPGGLTLFVETRVPPPRMIVFGAIDFAAALTRAGKFLGYHVTVCDGRPVFATSARFPAADEIVIDWPHRYLRRTDTDERTVLCVLTHDAKFDVPLLQTALRMPVAYVGAMGSRRTHEDRNQRLREAGVTERELSRLRSPIGLDLGARTPEETAVSIAAEIVAARYGGAGTPLTGSGSSIHRG